MSGTLSQLFFFCFCSLLLRSSSETLETPHSVSGMVWEDWNEDGIRQAYEPGFPYVKVTLLYQPTEDMELIVGNTEPYVGAIKEVWTMNDGKYHFDCLSAGSYAVKFESPMNRPTTFSPPNAGADTTLDSDVTIMEDNYGMTELFLAESAASTSMDCGMIQTRFVNLFTMTGREMVPESPTTVVGTSYTIYDAPSSTLYYRIYHDIWKGENVAERSAFQIGWPGVSGERARSLGDRSNVKTNFWVVPEDIKPYLLTGNMFFFSAATGSFSDLGRIRGNWNSFYNKQTLQASVPLSGQSVVPTPVETRAYGKLWVSCNLNADYIDYKLSFEDLGRATITAVSVYGPAGPTSEGAYLFDLTLDGDRVNVSTIPDFVENFATGQLYVLVRTSEYPVGHLRGQITRLSQVVYTSVFDLKSTSGAIGQAAFSLDTVKHHLAYYVYFEGLSGSELYTVIQTDQGYEYLEGDYNVNGGYIKQGFFWETNEELEKELLSGHVKIFTNTEFGTELSGYLGNWF